MRYIISSFLLFPLSLFCCSAAEIDISLPHQAVLDLCAYPSIREGVIDILYLYVDDLWHRGQYHKIFPVLNLITKISPEDIEAWTLGGWFLINGIAPKLSGEKRKKVIEYALEFMKEGAKRNPTEPRIYMELAIYYYKNQEYENALYYLEMVDMPSPSYHLLHLKAHTYQRLGRINSSIDIWKQIKEMFPEMKDVAERNIKELQDVCGENR